MTKAKVDPDPILWTTKLFVAVCGALVLYVILAGLLSLAELVLSLLAAAW